MSRLYDDSPWYGAAMSERCSSALGTKDDVAEGPRGELAHRDLLQHSEQFEPRLCHVTDGVYCAVGYGLANASFVLAPEGLVIVDSGESIEEAGDHVEAIRKVTDVPARAVIYSHSHYADGTAAWNEQTGGAPLEVWGHERIPEVRANVGAEIGPAYLRRLALQFGLFLPAEGPDAMPNQGLGPFFFNPNHPKRTPGFLPLTHPVSGETQATIAGERFELIPAAADSEDSLILWLPDRDTVINNNVWPALFNVYPLRGELYRDPLLLVAAIDRIRELDPEHLVGVHGPPVSGREAVRKTLRDCRDAIQYLWDQTVRGINRGRSAEELAHEVQLPPHLERAPKNRQFYGAVPHHVRQIHNGLFGWYGTDPSELFPHPPEEEARRIIEGFGGRERLLEQTRAALDADDPRWAARLASWLVRVDAGDAKARELGAAALRTLAQRTTSSNVRSVCLMRARELEGQADSSRFNSRPAREHQVLAAPPGRFVQALRVQLDPAKSADFEGTALWRFTDPDTVAALCVRRGVAEYLDRDPGDAEFELRLTHRIWARLFAGRVSLEDATAAGDVELIGDPSRARAFFDLFDFTKLRGRD
jgi:alkyl sulfatase BDS1-like metallo-beta-lactamase superfamily hydrolase